MYVRPGVFPSPTPYVTLFWAYFSCFASFTLSFSSYTFFLDHSVYALTSRLEVSTRLYFVILVRSCLRPSFIQLFLLSFPFPPIRFYQLSSRLFFPCDITAKVWDGGPLVLSLLFFSVLALPLHPVLPRNYGCSTPAPVDLILLSIFFRSEASILSGAMRSFFS